MKEVHDEKFEEIVSANGGDIQESAPSVSDEDLSMLNEEILETPDEFFGENE